jgi:hypothetical protein
MRLPLPLLLLCCALLPPPAAAQAPAPEDAEVKAAIVQRLLGFVRWPGESRAPVTLCTLSEDAVAHALWARPTNPQWRLKRLPLDSAMAEGCDAIYTGTAPPLEAPGLLTLSDGPASGGMVRLDVSERRVVFDVDLPRARAAGLDISAHLLRLARQVHGLGAAP